MKTWKISCLFSLALALSPAARADIDLTKLKGVFTGSGKLSRELDDGWHRERFQGTGTLRIRNSGLITFNAEILVGDRIRRERIKIKVDKKKGIARVSPAFPVWMEKPHTVSGPVFTRVRTWTVEVSLLATINPPSSSIDTMRIDIDRTVRRVTFRYVVHFKNDDRYNLRFDLSQKR